MATPSWWSLMILLIDQVSKNSGEKKINLFNVSLREEKLLYDVRPDVENESTVKKCWV